MLYTIGSLVIGAISTGFSLWLKARKESQMAENYHRLQEKYDTLVNQYNALVTDANGQIKTLQKQRDELLDALQNSGKPGVFADLLRKRNAGSETPS